jgi:hypothetical protein
VASNYRQFFTGTSTQTIVLPVTSTLVTGMAYEIENNSTGTLTVNSSGGNLVGTIPSGVCAHAVCIGTTLTTAADWDWDYISTTTITGTGANVLGTAPTIASLNLTTALTLASASGTAGQVLTSGGSGGAPTWSSPSTTSISNGTSNVTVNSSGGSITATTAGTAAVTIDTSQNVGIGTSSPSDGQGYGKCLDIYSTTGGAVYFHTSTSTNYGWIGKYNSSTQIADSGSAGLIFTTGNGISSISERMRITPTGRVGIGTTAPSALLNISGGVGSGAGVQLAATWNGDFFGYACDAGSFNAALTGLAIQKVGSTNRSLSAAGTLNASGADYAEYMTKCGDFTVAKGDVVGINANGKLTNVFADAISFVVKSTDPSYVGGDSWGSKSQDKDGEKYTPEELEAIRQTVDRIAFSGQVPVNVTGATAGQYIIPVDDNGAIKGEAVSNPTFEQYLIAVGKVVAIESDGRAKIIVKVA